MTPNTTIRPALYWAGPPPLVCDCCGIAIHSTFIDGKTTRGGAWGCLHPACHDRIGVGLGMGRGQKYERQDNDRWLRTEG